MIEIDRLAIRIHGCFFKWVMKDPYPEVTAYKQEIAELDKLGLFFRLGKMYRPDPPSITVHQAWQDGFNFAKKLVLDELDREP